jgi:hypothetical protein
MSRSSPARDPVVSVSVTTKVASSMRKGGGRRQERETLRGGG